MNDRERELIVRILDLLNERITDVEAAPLGVTQEQQVRDIVTESLSRLDCRLRRRFQAGDAHEARWRTSFPALGIRYPATVRHAPVRKIGERALGAGVLAAALMLLIAQARRP
jgi:hypothetical protein